MTDEESVIAKIALMVEHESQRPKIIAMIWKQHNLWMTELINRTVRDGFDAGDVGYRMTPEEKEANREFLFFMTELVNQNGSENGRAT